jgi:uncharacterized protein YndB with AHSA1/START domain
MTSETKTTNGARERHVWKVTINAPIETVWNTLVKTDDVLPFFFGAVCDTANGIKVGKSMRMVSKNRKFAIVVGKVLEFTPPHRYSHTLAFTQNEGEEPAIVTYELKEIPGGTEFTLSSEAIPGTKTAKMVASGPFIVGNLKAVAETGRPLFSGRMVMALGPLMSLMTPKISRIENWPLDRI